MGCCLVPIFDIQRIFVTNISRHFRQYLIKALYSIDVKATHKVQIHVCTLFQNYNFVQIYIPHFIKEVNEKIHFVLKLQIHKNPLKTTQTVSSSLLISKEKHAIINDLKLMLQIGFTLRRRNFVSSSWMVRLRISDRKFVIHTTEMIL